MPICLQDKIIWDVRIKEMRKASSKRWSGFRWFQKCFFHQVPKTTKSDWCYKCETFLSQLRPSHPLLQSHLVKFLIMLTIHPTPRIALFVRSLVRSWQNLPHHIYMHHTYMHASGSRSRIIDMCIIHTCIRVKVQDHRYVHHTHIDQSQGSRIIDMCIIHTCSIVKDRGT